MSRPRGSGYEALPAHDELEEDLEEGSLPEVNAPSSLPTQPRAAASRAHRRTRSLSTLSIDATVLDAKLSQWRKAIKSKFAKKQCKILCLLKNPKSKSLA